MNPMDYRIISYKLEEQINKKNGDIIDNVTQQKLNNIKYYALTFRYYIEYRCENNIVVETKLDYARRRFLIFTPNLTSFFY